MIVNTLPPKSLAFCKICIYTKHIIKIVINKSINELKKTKAYQTETISENFEKVDEINDEISFINLKAEYVLNTLQSLKPNYKVILTLFYIEGFDLEEITEILKISYKNCRTTMSRAKDSLRKRASCIAYGVALQNFIKVSYANGCITASDTINYKRMLANVTCK